eukprot:CAMPEP_0175072474 /NCGR_PEP_ID=MMETSP0052_2-20121109/19935_1 /TAXON_ID=51329 ORGANISM="Polytomella parva, Strain SAG 63-3" /NCGR_SAMPLE_ID=MMETSP0052_2 /ASSEMBLY_ACC=CAM_ASM_000194 /LENGTH=99 /DNA_ID=CAMNT_0016339993 /DNA_START=198 /DNA_END=493 /DNA_ORIENTATION=-
MLRASPPFSHTAAAAVAIAAAFAEDGERVFGVFVLILLFAFALALTLALTLVLTLVLTLTLVLEEAAGLAAAIFEAIAAMSRVNVRDSGGRSGVPITGG